MAEDLAKLQVKLEAQADEYVKDLKRADAETKRAVDSMSKETERLKKQSSSMGMWKNTGKLIADSVKHGNCSSLTPLLNPVRTRKSLIWP